MVEKFATGKESYWPQIQDAMVSQIEALKKAQPWLAEDTGQLPQKAHDAAVKLAGIETPDAKFKRMRKADAAKRMAQLNVKSKNQRRNPEFKAQ
jgi:hypothetical protein